MNKIVYRYRVWRVEHKEGYTSRFSFKKGLTKPQFMKWFKIVEAKGDKVTPVLDHRMKNGGRSLV